MKEEDIKLPRVKLFGRLLLASCPVIGAALLAGLTSPAVHVGVMHTQGGGQGDTFAEKSAMPPWTYEADFLRYLGTVVEPLCGAPEGLTLTQRVSPLGVCEVSDGGVKVTLRERLRRGERGTPVTARDVAAALSGLCPSQSSGGDPNQPGDGEPCSWSAIEVTDEKSLTLTPSSRATEGLSSREASGLLLRALAFSPVAWAGPGELVEGTGPFYVERYLKWTTDQAEGAAESAESTASEDALMLRRRNYSLQFANTMVFHGVDAPQPEVAATQLASMLDTGALHIALGIEAPVAAELKVKHGWDTRWQIVPQPEKFVLWVVANPSREVRPAELDVLRQLSQNTWFLDQIGAREPTSLLPPTFHRLGGPSGVPLVRAEIPESEVLPCASAPEGSLHLLTNNNWILHASLAVRALRAAGYMACLDAVNAAEEGSKRENGDYDFSMLAVSASLLPTSGSLLPTSGSLLPASAWFFHENLSGWFGETDAEIPCAQTGDSRSVRACARALAGQEAVTENWDAQEDFARQLDQWVIPLAISPSSVAIADGVSGYDSAAGALVSEQLAAQSPRDRRARAMQVGLGAAAWLLLVLAGSALWDWRAARRREETLIRRTRMRQHDLGRPLVRAKQIVDSLPPDGDREELMVQLDEALDRIDGLASGFAEDASTSPGGLTEERIIGRSLRRALDMVRARFPRDAIGEITWSLLEPDPVVVAPRGTLMQLFENVIENAIKYRGAEPARLAIRCDRVGDHVVITVEDHGVGLPPDVPPDRVFDLGVRLVGPDGPSGTGTGLAIARESARAAGGAIRCARRANPTRFEIRLPVSHRSLE